MGQLVILEYKRLLLTRWFFFFYFICFASPIKLLGSVYQKGLVKINIDCNSQDIVKQYRLEQQYCKIGLKNNGRPNLLKKCLWNVVIELWEKCLQNAVIELWKW
eukprot:TRINITY_DN7478_c0_g1_i7.p4 TRINITY_DN7478_c0_g1~~TRINITY_DN7478_c0_g1_i7.p4  ORF type:complete len:104 (+),score=8.89 TRINITY_DN7478_c0_g1_i7:419-730(+)